MKISALLIAAVALAATAPAFAERRGMTDNTAVTYDAKHDKYCVSQMVTGNLMPVKDCRTKSDWAKAGVTVGADTDAAKLASK